MWLVPLLACAGLEASADYSHAALEADLEGFERWAAPEGWGRRSFSCSGAHGTWVALFVNPAAADALAAGEGLPPGAALVNVSYEEDGETVKLRTAMRKVPAFAPASEDWYWGVFDEKRTILLGGAAPACVACHAAQPSLVRHLDGAPPLTPNGCADPAAPPSEEDSG